MPLKDQSIGIILVAGGSGSRFGADLPKQFLPLAGKKVLEYSLELFSSLAYLNSKVLVLPEVFLEDWKHLQNSWRVVPGGATRQDSVQAGLKALSAEVEWILIHDAARPLLSEAIILRGLEGAQASGAAIAAIPLADTLKKADAGQRVVETIPRDHLYQIQTPQVFSRVLLEAAFRWAAQEGFQGTDEATLVEKMGGEVRLTLGAVSNFKITRAEDLVLAEAILRARDR